MTEVRVWRPAGAPGVLCMEGVTAAYEVDPRGEHVFGLVLAGGMVVRRGRELHRFGPGDLCAWDTSARHVGRPYRSARWRARLIVVEAPDELLRRREPLVRDPRLAARFAALHRMLEAPPSVLAVEGALAAWLAELAGAGSLSAAAARRDPALRRAGELLADDPAANVTLAQLAAAAGVSRHRLTRLFLAGYGLPPHRFQIARRIRLARRLLEQGRPAAEVAQAVGFADQSHLHRHFRRTLGITPARYAALLRANVQDGVAPRV